MKTILADFDFPVAWNLFKYICKLEMKILLKLYLIDRDV